MGRSATAKADRERVASRAGLAENATPTNIPASSLALWNEVARDPRRRRQLARTSVAFYAWFYLRARGKRVSVPPCHIEWYKIIGPGSGYRKSRSQVKTLLLAPRSHGKSHVSCWVVPLHRICFQRNVRILILCANQDAASKWLRRIRTQLESNPRIKEDFGCVDLGEGRVSTGFRDPEAPWTDHKIQVQRGDQSLADPTIVASGAGSGITGGRFDLIIADDPESDRSVLTENVRKQTRTWFRATIQELLEPWGESLVIGTKKHNDDLYAHLEKDRTVRTIKHRAIQGDIPKHEWVLDKWGKIIGVKVIGHRPAVLWPEVWPLEALLKKRESMTSVLFARENQNEVVSDENASFRKEWLDQALSRGKSMAIWRSSEEVPGDWVIIQAVDPSFVDDEKKAQDADSDYFVVFTVAVNIRNWHRRILRGWRGRGRQPSLYLGKIRSMAAPFTRPSDPYHPAGALKWIVVENNSFGKFYELGLRRDTDLPLVPHSTTIKKADPFDGVDAMAALYENGQISWACKAPLPGADEAAKREYEQHVQYLDSLYSELYGLGSEAHDDLVMSHWLSEIAVRRYRRFLEKQGKGLRPTPTRRVTAAQKQENIPVSTDDKGLDLPAAPTPEVIDPPVVGDDVPPRPPGTDPPRPNPPRPVSARGGATTPAERVLTAVRMGASSSCTAAEWADVKAALGVHLKQCLDNQDFRGAQHALSESARLSALHEPNGPKPPPPPAGQTAEPSKNPEDAPLGRPFGWRPGYQ